MAATLSTGVTELSCRVIGHRSTVSGMAGCGKPIRRNGHPSLRLVHSAAVYILPPGQMLAPLAVWSSRRGSSRIEHLGSAYSEQEIEALKLLQGSVWRRASRSSTWGWRRLLGRGLPDLELRWGTAAPPAEDRIRVTKTPA